MSARGADVARVIKGWQEGLYTYKENEPQPRPTIPVRRGRPADVIRHIDAWAPLDEYKRAMILRRIKARHARRGEDA